MNKADFVATARHVPSIMKAKFERGYTKPWRSKKYDVPGVIYLDRYAIPKNAADYYVVTLQYPLSLWTRYRAEAESHLWRALKKVQLV